MNRLARPPWQSVEAKDWNDWAWQFRNRIDDAESAARAFDLSPEEVQALVETRPTFRFGVTPYYASLAHPGDPNCPIRKQVLPRPEESWVRLPARRDPLGEEALEVVPNLVHRYPDRVLLLATDRCPVYCRFCTRRRIVGRTERQAPRRLLEEAFGYVEAHEQIREVIVSGGDALMLSDRQLDHIFGRLRSIAHLEIIRLATRMPVTCPMRITPRLIDCIRTHGPIYVMTHFNHPMECTLHAERAVARMVDAGLVVYNQSVLLAGINDRAETIRELNRRLVRMRVTPYYLHQCDLAEGIEHFRTPLQAGLDIIDALRGHSSGLMVPQLCVDVPGGLGKVTVVPDWIVERNAERVVFRTYTGETAAYAEPSIDT
ncbi:MAG: KamA family radical SAM protein [Myxococcota bacterium]